MAVSWGGKVLNVHNLYNLAGSEIVYDSCMTVERGSGSSEVLEIRAYGLVRG